MIGKWFHIISLIVIYLLGAFFIVHTHEINHKNIWGSYGIKSEIHYEEIWKGHVYTKAEEHCPNETCNFQQNLNEMIGYPLLQIYIAIGALIILIEIRKEFIKEYESSDIL